MAILRDLVDLDCKLTNRSKGMINTRALRARDAGLLPLKGHGTSAAHYSPRDAANYIICSLTTFVKASDVAEEIQGFSSLPISKPSWQALIGNNLWHLEDGKVPKALNSLSGALSFLIEMAGDPKRQSSKGWKAIDRKYKDGTLTLRRSVASREAFITLVPKSKKAHPFHIEYKAMMPDEEDTECRVYEAVTVPIQFVAEFGGLFAGGGDD
jgi:hypothetical protein